MLSFPSHAHCQSLTTLVRGRIARLAARGRSRAVAGGELVYRMGDPTDHLYVVLDGRVRTSIVSPAGRELVLGVHGPGEVFGELCFCAIRRRQEQAVAVVDSRVVRLRVDDLLSLVAGDQAEALALLDVFCQRMADLQDRLAQLAFANVRTRLGLLLLRLVDGQPAGPDGGAVCPERLTHEELAARVATTREQVTAILTQFREQGLVDYRRGGPIVVFPDRLGRHLETAS
ncbi:Crp/Fnr family transcriptional regulator [Caldinitratiruptor microaerophilus]|uniref:Crp/Fnr family transcriptional regulator n=1 Tax=Caldinitratiruptor microaerophilus TaxID=671077 RepID=A0AA35G719_9FIRM|nr:Crp/Fnr family transcriptional regulator [Caldinitratiruptor microaerophilus]BDG59330.1 Crp/Fnr family transcriptional regulator [Caldinitratiruptor microaerophilus]